MTMMPVIEASQRACICQGPPKWSQRNACGRHVRIQPTIPGVACFNKKQFPHGRVQSQRLQRTLVIPRAENDDSEENVKYNTEFGYSRKDVIFIGVGLIVGGFGAKYGFEVAGVDPLQAGTYAQLVIFLGGLVAWVATYVFRVSTKNMTYVQQLKDYEESVMEKRLEEMTDVEKEKLMKEVEEASGK